MDNKAIKQNAKIIYFIGMYDKINISLGQPHQMSSYKKLGCIAPSLREKKGSNKF